MKQGSDSKRITALDGLRGLAIIMVFLSHINATFISRSNILNSILFDSGVIGVSFLFILSGFLMAYLYPQPVSTISFLQKRYTRIFPLFLTVCSSLFLIRFFSLTHWYTSVLVLLLLAGLAHLFWVFVIKRYIPSRFKTAIFFAFLIFQIGVGIFYLWIMHHPAVYYYDQMSVLSRSFTNWFVNATLTIPLGKYVEMFDPVYWSLAAEILFYLLYPFFCVPVIAYMSRRSRFSKLILLVCLFPFFAAIAWLSQHVWNVSVLRFQLFYYFVTGMTLGYIYRKYPENIAKIHTLFPGFFSYVTLIFFFGCILFTHIIAGMYPAYIIWIQMFLAIPFTLLLCIGLSNKTALSKFFQSKFLVYFGIISYSIYLSHMFILQTMINITKQPQTVITTTLYIIVTFLLTVILCSIFYFLLERPYFARSQAKKRPAFVSYATNIHAPRVFIGMSLGLIVIVFIVYQSNLNFFSFTEPYSHVVTSSNSKKIISLRQNQTLTMQLHTTHDNFGVVDLHLSHKSVPYKKFTSQRIVFRIKEKGSQDWYATSDYTITHPNDNLPSSFGFPLIAKSAGKTYIVSISEENPSSSEYVQIDTNDNNVTGIFLIDKKSLFKHPQQLMEFVKNKVQTVLRDREAQQVLSLSLPFILFTLYIIVTDRRKKIILP